MDKTRVRVLESIGYVACFFMIMGAVFRELGVRVPLLGELGALILGIVLVRLGAYVARSLAELNSRPAPRSSAGPGKPEPSQ